MEGRLGVKMNRDRIVIERRDEQLNIWKRM